MDAKPKRPLWIWICQIFMTISGIFFLVLPAYSFTFEGPIDADAIAGAIVCVAVAILLFLACLGLAMRHSWGRWLGILVLSVVLFLFAFVAYELTVTEDLTREDLVAGIVIVLGISVPSLILIPVLIMSRKVKEFFAPPGEGNFAESDFAAPPPPPTFDT